MRLAVTALAALACSAIACSRTGGGASSATPGAPTESPPVASVGSLSPAAPLPIDADALHAAAVVIDTHDDVTQRLMVAGSDLGASLPGAQTDIPRMRQGGLDAEFLSVWVAPMLYPGEKAYARSVQELDAIDAMISKNGSSAVLARTAADVRAAAATGKTAFLIGVEGGHSLGDASDEELLRRVRTFYDRGARYMTLTWSNSNRLGGSSGDAGKDRGLTPFGERVVHLMNDLGMLVDISHVSDATFTDAVRTSRLPVLASHSSSRALSPHPRNMTDDMLRAVRDNGGAVCINFGPEFLDADWNARWKAATSTADIGAIVKAHPRDPEAAQAAIWEKFEALARTFPEVPASKVIDHIEHVAKVAGVDHTCLGSDFDGIPAGPAGLEDVSKFPVVTRELVARGFTPADVRKILGENVLRVLEESEHGAIAREKQ
ncbi:MAG TPA: dipeptidase [Polyangiaceae bacterium]|nr:dipeptidase [Polyangiaceae bacterium]